MYIHISDAAKVGITSMKVTVPGPRRPLVPSQAATLEDVYTAVLTTFCCPFVRFASTIIWDGWHQVMYSYIGAPLQAESTAAAADSPCEPQRAAAHFVPAALPGTP
jgi:hypothetical protein